MAAVTVDGRTWPAAAAESGTASRARSSSRRTDDVRAHSEFARTTLDSGADGRHRAMTEVRSVSVGFWFDVGARDEPDELAGTSHFLEHLLFKGTPTRTRQGHRRRVRRGRRRHQRLHRQGVHVLLRACARRRPADGARRAVAT